MNQFLLFRLRRESDLYLIQHHTLFNPICDINNVWSRSESQISWNKLFLTVWTWYTVSFAYFCLNYPCSPAAIGFPVAKATSFHACGTALQKYEGNLLTSQLIFFVFVLDAYSAIFTVMQMFLAQLPLMLLEFQTFVVFFIDASVAAFVGHDRSSTAPQTCQRTGRHDHCCKVWPASWHHQGYKYIFYILVITACPTVARIGSSTPMTLNRRWIGNTQDNLDQGCQI